MGATHVINHQKDLVGQIKDLSLSVPIKYAIPHSVLIAVTAYVTEQVRLYTSQH